MRDVVAAGFKKLDVEGLTRETRVRGLHQIAGLAEVIGSEAGQDVLHPPIGGADSRLVFKCLGSLGISSHHYQIAEGGKTVAVWTYYFGVDAFSGALPLMCAWAVEGTNDQWWIRAFPNFEMDFGIPWAAEAEDRRSGARALMDFVLRETSQHEEALGTSYE